MSGRSAFLSAVAALVFCSPWQIAAAETIYIADPAADAIYTVDSATSGAAPTLLSCSFTTSAGTGPAFGTIYDIGVSPSGSLYVLDGQVSTLRLLQVNTSNGNRTTVLTMPNGKWFPEFWCRQDGEFLFIRMPRAETVPIGTPATVEVVNVVPGSPNPTETVVSQGAFEGGIFGAALVGGAINILQPQTHGAWILKETGNTIVRSPETKIAVGSNFVEFASGPSLGWDFEFTVNAARPAEAMMVVVDDSELPTSTVRPHRSVTIDPTGPNGDQTAFFKTRNEVIGSTTFNVAHAASFAANASASSAGTWPASLEREFGGPTTVPSEVSLWAKPAPKSYLLADTTGSTLQLAEAFPASIIQVNPTSGAILSRVAMTPPPASGISANAMSRLSEFVMFGGNAYAAFEEDARIVRINPSTGASQLVTSGRPTGFSVPSGGFNAMSRMRFAVGGSGAADAANWHSY